MRDSHICPKCQHDHILLDQIPIDGRYVREVTGPKPTPYR
jgi:hypothetical protein